VSASQVRLCSGVEVELLGQEVLCRLPEGGQVLRLSDGAADAVRRLSAGQPLGDVHQNIIDQLVSLGVLEEPGVASLSRRKLLTATGVGVVAGISVLALPTVAAASSQFLFYSIIGIRQGDDDAFFLWVGLNTAFPIGTLGTLTWIGAAGSPYAMEAVDGSEYDLVSDDPDSPDVETYFVSTGSVGLTLEQFEEAWALWNLRFTVGGVTYNVGESMREDGTIQTF